VFAEQEKSYMYLWRMSHITFISGL